MTLSGTTTCQQRVGATKIKTHHNEAYLPWPYNTSTAVLRCGVPTMMHGYILAAILPEYIIHTRLMENDGWWTGVGKVSAKNGVIL